MAFKIIVPRLGESTKPLSLVEWKAGEGDPVEQGSVVLIVETEKVRYDIEARISGFLHILLEEGSEGPIGSVAGFIAETKEELEKLQSEIPKPATPTAQEKVILSTAEMPAPLSSKSEGERVRISPVARKMAEEHMVDISKITGTGPGGRIVREDIEREISAGSGVNTVPETHQGKRVKSKVSLTGMRKTIAERMHGSLSISAQLTVMGEIDMTEMVEFRQNLVAHEAEHGVKITYTDLMVIAAAQALKELPLVNSSIVGNEIVMWEDINIGVAVALEDGLIVPVVKNADGKSLVEISHAVKTLAGKARQRKLAPEEVEGGTFTITNLGALSGGYRFETVIINQPESAILGTGGITDRVVARDGEIVIRPIMTYYFTYDHRAFDGAVAARFIEILARFLENPGLLDTRI